MNKLINMSNLQKGGAIAVAVSFCVYLNNSPKKNVYVVVSKKILEEVRKNNLKIPNLIEHDYTWKSFIFLNRLVKEKKINSVFTLFGPILWRPNIKHIVGFALPWLIYDSKGVRKISSPFFYLRKKIESYIKSIIYKITTDKYVVESADVKLNLSKKLKIIDDNIFVVENSFNQFFEDVSYKIAKKKNPSITRILYISAFYPHKNFITLLKAINSLNAKQNNLVYELVLTIPDNDLKELNNYCDPKYIVNKGYVSPRDVPALYRDCDIVVSPSLLECFSALYVEAIFMKKPLIVSDFSFSREICKNAALYFDALSYHDLEAQVLKIERDESLRNKLSYNCTQILKQFPSSHDRARNYLKILDEN